MNAENDDQAVGGSCFRCVVVVRVLLGLPLLVAFLFCGVYFKNRLDTSIRNIFPRF